MNARWLSVCFLATAGCSVLLVSDECDRDDDCDLASQACIAGACVIRDDDAIDVGPQDGGQEDAGNVADMGFVDPCPTGRIEVTNAVTDSTRWVAECVYVLTTNIFVEGQGTVLTIEAGTRIEGRSGSALVVTRGSRLSARGTREAPIVFTSAQPVGSRSPGDWGGVALLGGAPINVPGGVENLEGLDDDPRTLYGGDDPNHSCGDLEYVRIEFAGFRAFLNNELNGLTIGGCGLDTGLRYIQVHRGSDDGIEFFGGSAFLQYIVISRAQDDSLDWDEGWTGAGQFIVIQADEFGDNGFEADNLFEGVDLQPRSNPTLFNVTMVGSRMVSGEGRGMLLRDGTAGRIANVIVMGHRVAGLDIRTTSTSSCAQAEIGCTNGGGALDIQGGIFYDLGTDGTTYAETDDDEDDDGGFDEAAWLRTRSVILGQDPQLLRPFDLGNPSFEPISTSIALTSTLAETPPAVPEQFERGEPFIGAMRNGEDWTEGWTAFPED